MPRSSYCAQDERIIIHPPESDWARQQPRYPDSLASSRFILPARDPSSLWDTISAKYRSTHTSSSWPLSHGAADEGLLGDAFTQTYIHKYACIFIHKHQTPQIHLQCGTFTFRRENCSLDALLALFTTPVQPHLPALSIRRLSHGALLCLNCIHLNGVRWQAIVKSFSHTQRRAHLCFPICLFLLYSPEVALGALQ